VSPSLIGVVEHLFHGSAAGFPYLDKFAVSPTAQGDKIGDEVWQEMVESQPRLLWRSRSSNRVNGWYFDRSHGSYMAHLPEAENPSPRDDRCSETTGRWTVFWRGLPDDEIMDAVHTALMLPATFR
jgi:bifunctional N-acetylglutamate synthase/kinase